MNLIRENTCTYEELATKMPLLVFELHSANGVVTASSQVQCYITSLNARMCLVLMPHSPAVLSLGYLRRNFGFDYPWLGKRHGKQGGVRLVRPNGKISID